jgi:hypothetical protein
MRGIAVVLGLICVRMGWAAISHGYLWHSGYNPRISTETSSPTLSWVIYGALLVLAGIFPWKWMFSRRKGSRMRYCAAFKSTFITLRCCAN